MFRLSALLYAVTGPTLAGIFMVVALATGYDTLKYVVGSSALGALIALPVAYFVAKAIKNAEVESGEA